MPDKPPVLCFPCLCEGCNCLEENKFEKLQCNSNGPFILTDKISDDAIIVSSFDNHFQQHSQILRYNNYTDISWGYMGSYGASQGKSSFKTILQFSSDGMFARV